MVLFQKEKCGERSTAQILGNEPLRKMDSVLRNYFLGKGFAKPRLMFLKFGGDFGFCPRGERGLGNESARDFFLGFYLVAIKFNLSQ